MKRCIVIGGGFSGLTSAVYLSKAGFKVTLLESSPKLGGRAYSLKDKETCDVIDNGQHILMGCYNYTLNFLKEISAEENLITQDRLEINFVDENFELLPLAAPKIIYPFNLLFAILKYKALTTEDKLRFISFFTKIPFYSNRDLERMTVAGWLKRENQSDSSIKAFWEILVVGALNTNMNNASAKIFASILKEIFFKGNKAATILIPKFGLTETYCGHAFDYIVKKGGKVNLGESVIELKSNGGILTEIITEHRSIKDFDFVVSAVPLYAFNKIKKDPLLNIDLQLNYSSILSVHLWLKKNPLKEKFYGLINSPVHWIFNHLNHVTMVISDADELVKHGTEEIFNLACGELEKFFTIKRTEITAFQIIKEKRATFIPSNEIINKRPNTQTKLLNMYLAGDWINTGLPSTIESAVKSGKLAADLIINS